MQFTIKGSDPINLELFTDDEERDIIQNIVCILKTSLGSCPGLRSYGLDPGILHKPVPVAKAAYSVSVTRQMQLYEPRATLIRLEFEDDPDHPMKLNPILEVSIP